jgi:hypothetical protein
MRSKTMHRVIYSTDSHWGFPYGKYQLSGFTIAHLLFSLVTLDSGIGVKQDIVM